MKKNNFLSAIQDLSKEFGTKKKTIAGKPAVSQGEEPVGRLMYEGAIVSIDVSKVKLARGIYRIWFDQYYYIGRAQNIKARISDHVKIINHLLTEGKTAGEQCWYHNLMPHLKEPVIAFAESVELYADIEEAKKLETAWLQRNKEDPFLLNFDKGKLLEDQGYDLLKALPREKPIQDKQNHGLNSSYKKNRVFMWKGK